jgi:xylulokinase
MMADATGLRIVRHADAEVGPSLGAARLAWRACDGADAAQRIFQAPPVEDAFEPRAAERARLRERAARWTRLYESVAPRFEP